MNTILKSDNSSWQYICNKCFKRQGECDCKSTLLGIDPNIIKALQILHRKNYQTVGCCEGHIITYKTPKGTIYTQLSQGYITLDSHSYNDIQREKEKGFNFTITPIDPKTNRYQILIPGRKVKMDRFEDFQVIKKVQLASLEECLEKFAVRDRREPIILTNY